jgi:hypothetical protein
MENAQCSMIDIQDVSTSGPFLYAIYVSPLFDISDLSLFADDNYKINTTERRHVIPPCLEQITKWLKGSGLGGRGGRAV